MTLRHFTIFLCVCDEKNMTAAARKLYIAQPSVSQAIAELEKYYAVKLFERLGRKLFITAAGQELSHYARHIVNLTREAEDAMREMGNHGILRVGASVTIGTYLLNGLLEEFSRTNPGVKISSIVNNTKILEELLLSDELDIALVEGKVHSPEIVVKPFMDDELVLVCSPSHPLAIKPQITLPVLSNMAFVVREEGSGTRELFEAVMDSRNIKWNMIGVYNNAESIKNSVIAGLGLTVISRMAIEKEITRKELMIIEITDSKFKRQFSIIYHKNKFISPVLQRFIQQTMDYVLTQTNNHSTNKKAGNEAGSKSAPLDQ
jgi:LysR family transcriptional regulator, transcriptional activator of the cysJI operon